MDKSENSTEQRRTTDAKRLFLEELSKTMGIITPAMEKAGIKSRATIMRWRDSDPDFAQAMRDCESKAGDFVESKLMQNVSAGMETSIIFYCKTRLRERGFGQTVEVTGKDGKDLIPEIRVEVIDTKEQVRNDNTDDKDLPRD